MEPEPHDIIVLISITQNKAISTDPHSLFFPESEELYDFKPSHISMPPTTLESFRKPIAYPLGSQISYSPEQALIVAALLYNKNKRENATPVDLNKLIKHLQLTSFVGTRLKKQ